MAAGVARTAVGGRGLARRRPNIIVILTDDQGYGDASCNGNPILRTPNTDRLHDEGVRFRDFHVSPTCAPTRCALMTGRHEFHSGVTHTIYERERMSLGATTLSEVLRSAGYTTGVFGKWHLGDEPDYQPGRRGFDEAFIHGAGGIGQTFPGTCGDAPGNSYVDPVILHNGTFVETHGYCTDVFFEQAATWIDGVRGTRPFFAYITPNAPHTPLVCPPGYEALYRDQVDADTATFFAMIANIDDNVGRLLARLDGWGIDRYTLVVFMNDNGGTGGVRVFNAGMRGQKCQATTGGTRAMSLWRWPGALQPATCEQLTAHIDLFPTLTALAGARVPPEMGARLEGYSLVPILENPSAAWHDDRVLLTHVGRWEPGAEPVKLGECSLRWRHYLLIWENGRWALYDLREDPGETTDVSGRHADIVARLAGTYEEWWAETLPQLSNEQAYRTAPGMNPFKRLYWEQYRGPGPNHVPPPPEMGL